MSSTVSTTHRFDTFLPSAGASTEKPRRVKAVKESKKKGADGTQDVTAPKDSASASRGPRKMKFLRKSKIALASEAEQSLRKIMREPTPYPPSPTPSEQSSSGVGPFGLVTPPSSTTQQPVPQAPVDQPVSGSTNLPDDGVYHPSSFATAPYAAPPSLTNGAQPACSIHRREMDHARLLSQVAFEASHFVLPPVEVSTSSSGAPAGDSSSPSNMTRFAAPRPLRVVDVTPEVAPTSTHHTILHDATVAPHPTQAPPLDVSAMVEGMIARADDEATQAEQETENQFTTLTTELAVIMTERRLNTPPAGKERPDTPTLYMAMDWLYKDNLRNGFYHLLKTAIQPLHLADPTPASFSSSSSGQGELKVPGSHDLSQIEAYVAEEAWRRRMEHPRPTGVPYLADIQRMEDIAETFEEDFLRPYVHSIPRFVAGDYLPISERFAARV